MRVSELRTLYAYNEWANNRLLETAKLLPWVDWIAPGIAGQPSLRACFAHILTAEWIWRSRCQAALSPTTLPVEEDFPDLPVLVERWNDEANGMRDFLAALDDESLNQTIHYRTTGGRPFSNLLWHLLVHVVNHGTQHRSEIALTLTLRGLSPGDVDFIVFLRQNTPAP